MANKRLNQIRKICQKEHSQYHKLDNVITAMFDAIVHQHKIYEHCLIYQTYYSYSYHAVEDWKDVGAVFSPKGIFKNGPTIIIFIRIIRDYVLEIKKECRQQNVSDWPKVVYKELLKVIRHEFRHYQQYKHFKDNGLDFIDYIDLLKMKDIPYNKDITEVDAAIYSEDPENSGSLNFLIMDYCVEKIQSLQKLIKEDPESKEEYEKQIKELYKLGKKFIDRDEINKFCQSNNMEVK